jgi:cystathionine gamma-synthase
MGGSIVLNPLGRYYGQLKAAMREIYEDVFWPEDAIFLERNSRDFIARIHRVNGNAEAVCETLLSSPRGRSLLGPSDMQLKRCFTRSTTPQRNTTRRLKLPRADTAAYSP